MTFAKPWPSAKISRNKESGVGRGAVTSSHYCAKIKMQIGLVFACELLHALVLCKAGHVQVPKATIAGGEERALEERRPDAMALPGVFNRECRFRLCPPRRADGAQLGGTAQHIADKEAVNDRIEPKCELGIFAQEVLRDAARETVAPAFRIKAEQMVAVEIGFGDPQFDGSAHRTVAALPL